MKKLQHPNLIRLHEVIDDDENDKLYMGMFSTVLSLPLYSYGLCRAWRDHDLESANFAI
jgi:hypothetical protein